MKKNNLPKRLTISFPLWILMDTPGESACYHDLDKIVREHAERGFNCIRLDDGAGLCHDINGNRRGAVEIMHHFGEFEKTLRQQHIIGDGGKCDLLKRLFELCEAAKKYNVYLILSSWYYLHTYCFHPEGDPVCDELFKISPHDRFMAFAKFHHYIIKELEEKGYDDRIAFVEILNEANGLPFVNGYGGKNGLDDDELAKFTREHEDAILWLKKERPQLIFGYDSYTPWDDPRQIPKNMDVYNFHAYYMWNIYDIVISEHKEELILDKYTEEDVRLTRKGRIPAADDWYERETLYNNLDRTKIPLMEKYLEEKLIEKYADYIKAVEENLENVRKNTSPYPNVPIVCGEGVSYIGHKELIWEEKSETYWKLVEEVIRKYKEFGMWGTVVRTCMGPEDPSWDICADRIKRINRVFLED